MFFAGSHNVTRASQANREFVVQRVRRPDGDNVATYLSWYEILWATSQPLELVHTAPPVRRLQGKTSLSQASLAAQSSAP